jgi:hypothetical protein
MQITSNSHEYSLSIGNLDICAMRPTGVKPELMIAFKGPEWEPEQQVILSPAQAQALRHYLNSREVQEILGQTDHLNTLTLVCVEPLQSATN